ncbi:septal ring lytic transglycosylase RlpA family protein [Lysobacter pythonis]|uniref:Endolytic peptidoglycan transglycosylase RlpA n=1 Tax=Solilutibacter pythonis TaxID=2483112 RepID=A0A3M2HHA3_9GAMM|nr:septal ring lytic transglycosylase RlpA family protein [Lysobacter pythonis]RMH89091.1 septal ring lytic transglycosylase RlpA family protein [Lysobacter pythonis]
MRAVRLGLLAAAGLLLAACAGPQKKTGGPVEGKRVDTRGQAAQPSRPRKVSPYAPAREDLSKRGDYVAGGLYAPGVKDTVPDYIPNVDAIPEPEVLDLPRARHGNRSPYTVLGKSYTVLDDHSGYVERGMASYYGNKFHGRRTSSQEVYDMYAFTAAHRNLPLPSFARVTNLDNGKSVVVRVNDRGPFHSNRLIDLSYAAAVKLGYREKGTANVEVRALMPDERGVLAAAPASTDALLAAATAADPRPLPVRAAQRVATGNQPAAASAGEYRFDMLQNGRPMTADEFDAWMRARRVRIATGVPGKPDPALRQAPAQAAPIIAEVSQDNPAGVASMVAATPAAPVALRAGGIELQVASFASADNARRALGMLNQAGVPGARLLDAMVNGKRVWRLRVGPLAEASAPSLASRIAGLGFGQPSFVRQ